jgi:glutamate carboxypeptidase
MNIDSFRASSERHLPAALDFLREMVGMNSFTTNVEGVNAVAGIVGEQFSALSFSASSAPAQPGHGRHLFLTSVRRKYRPTLVLVSHLDTVFPPEEEVRNDFAWRREGDRIYGPGTNDIKGGTALIWLMLAAMRDVAPEVFAAANWIVALNACEEVDSADFGAACGRVLPADAKACLIFEADGGEGDRFSVVGSRKGRATFTVRVEGRGAHAGGGHARGANAIVQLAEMVTRLAGLTDYAAEVTVNVGTISGGTVNNRVPHEATATLEMRAFDMEAYARTKSAILAMAGEGTVRSEDGHACRVFVTLADETVPWPVNEQTDRLVEIWKSAGSELGLRVAREARGGLSDGNVLWQRFPTLDGLGPRGENSHCSEQSADGSKVQEWVDAASFVPKALLNARAISRMLADS